MQLLAMHGVLGFMKESWLASGGAPESPEAVARCSVADTAAGVDHNARWDAVQALGQQLLLVGRTDDAEECFASLSKDATQMARADRHARASLIAGLQGLSRHHLRPAWTGLQHALEAKNVPLQVSVQACAASAALYFGLGMRRPAVSAVDRALTLLDNAPEAHDLPRSILRGLKIEFTALDLLRQHERLSDLAFWPRHEEVAGSRVRPEGVLKQLADFRAEAGHGAFVSERIQFLEALIGIAYGGTAQEGKALDHIEQLQRRGFAAHAHAARHELALACIAAQKSAALRKVMQFYSGSSRRDIPPRHALEHEYCQAKLGELSGRDDLYIAHYRDYATKSLTHLRQTCAYITVPAIVRQAATEIPKDDIASRLSGKYRRAYQFILCNLHRNDLSIRDVAEAVGVTERALQLAFRSALGVSPSAVIRQCRMDRIRDELTSGAVGHGTTTLDVGKRWGLRSRSALSQAYKATFGELPSQVAGLAPQVVSPMADRPAFV
jgi:AraC-like DNA-binding protein